MTVILPRSNGQVEGQIHRLKLVKRQMYNRANFKLLRRRVIPYVPDTVKFSPGTPTDLHGNYGRAQIELTNAEAFDRVVRPH